MVDFQTCKGKGPGWGHEERRAIFNAACKYLGLHPIKVENIYEVGFHSMLQSGTIQLSGNILDKVKRDPAIQREQEKIIDEIKIDPAYNNRELRGSKEFSTQLGGQRAIGDMWKQALGFWRWTSTYSATWEMAFDELTWAVRSVNIKCNYVVNINGKITLQYSFYDTLDLRPDWGNRSIEYNAICTVLGFLYHDLLGGNDELKIRANWKKEINPV